MAGSSGWRYPKGNFLSKLLSPDHKIPLPVRLNANVFNEDRERLPGEENHYDQDMLWVDYLCIPEGIVLPIILKNAGFHHK